MNLKTSSLYWRQPALTALSAAERHIANLVVTLGPITQAEIAQKTEFTQQYVSKIANTLIDNKILERAGTVKSGRGQPSIALKINSGYAFSLGVSIMTDALAITLVDMAGKTLSHRLVALPSPSKDNILKDIQEALASFIESHDLDEMRLAGIGVGITGFFVGDRHKVNPPQVLEEIALIDIDDWLSKAFRVPVFVENDGNAAALGESMLGVGRWANTFAYIYMSMGLGGGIVIDGKPFLGVNGNAGEFANILRANDYYPTLENLRIQLCEAGTEIESIKQLVEEFDINLPGVDQWLDSASEPLSLMASAVASIFDPDAIVLGGRLPKALAEALAERINIFNSDRRSTPKPTPKIVVAETSGDATSLGAAMLPLKAAYYL